MATTTVEKVDKLSLAWLGKGVDLVEGSNLQGGASVLNPKATAWAMDVVNEISTVSRYVNEKLTYDSTVSGGFTPKIPINLFPSLSGSLDIGFKRSKNSAFEDYYVYESHTLAHRNIMDVASLDPTKDFNPGFLARCKALDAIGLDEEEKKRLANKIIEEFGTHVISTCFLGGVMYASRRTVTNSKASSWKLVADVTAEWFQLPFNVEVSTEKKSIIDQIVISTIGGSANLMALANELQFAEEKFKAWVDSIDASPAMVSFCVKPIVDYVERVASVDVANLVRDAILAKAVSLQPMKLQKLILRCMCPHSDRVKVSPTGLEWIHHGLHPRAYNIDVELIARPVGENQIDIVIPIPNIDPNADNIGRLFSLYNVQAPLATPSWERLDWKPRGFVDAIALANATNDWVTEMELRDHILRPGAVRLCFKLDWTVKMEVTSDYYDDNEDDNNSKESVLKSTKLSGATPTENPPKGE